MAKWHSGATTDSELTKSLEDSISLNDKEDTFLLKGLMYLGVGEKEEALKVFKKVFVDEIAANEEDVAKLKQDPYEF